VRRFDWFWNAAFVRQQRVSSSLRKAKALVISRATGRKSNFIYVVSLAIGRKGLVLKSSTEEPAPHFSFFTAIITTRQANPRRKR
jgi:hypothetical protein